MKALQGNGYRVYNEAKKAEAICHENPGLLVHALCWVHAERAIRKLEGSTTRFRQNIEEVQGLIWEYYQELKAIPVAVLNMEER